MYNNNNYLTSSKHPPNNTTTTKPLLTATVTESPMTSLIKSWLNGSKLRYVILILFSPLIIPIVFVTFPFICAAEVCYRRRRRREKAEAAPEMADSPVVVKKDGDVAGSLLERYLEDQLGLAIEILNECGGDLGGGYYSLDDHHHSDFGFNSRSNNSLC